MIRINCKTFITITNKLVDNLGESGHQKSTHNKSLTQILLMNNRIMRKRKENKVGGFVVFSQ